MSLNIYFDAVKSKLDIERDAVLARRLGMLPQHLNRARKQGSCPDEILAKIHEILGTPMEELALAREAGKAGAMQPVWERAYETVKRASAVLGIGAVLIGGSVSNDAHANAARSLTEKNVRSVTQVIDFPRNKDYRKLRSAVNRILDHFFLRFFGSFAAPAAI